VDREPYLTFGVLDAAGKAAHTTAVPLRFPQMMHDFAITASYAVFWDLPLAFNAMARRGWLRWRCLGL
jgi:carotenoid cleavage dioxygenase-like enzyme